MTLSPSHYVNTNTFTSRFFFSLFYSNCKSCKDYYINTYVDTLLESIKKYERLCELGQLNTSTFQSRLTSGWANERKKEKMKTQSK